MEMLLQLLRVPYKSHKSDSPCDNSGHLEERGSFEIDTGASDGQIIRM